MRRSLFVAIAILPVACAEVAMQPSPLTRTPAPAQYALLAAVDGGSSSAFSRHLAQGTIWVEVGAIAQGTVFRPRDTILTAEGANVHEAYLVVRDGVWTGFWLPYEQSFSPLAAPTPIQLQKERSP